MIINVVSHLQAQLNPMIFELDLINKNLRENDLYKEHGVQFHAVSNFGVSPLDRAFNYGDGCFTTIYANRNHIRLFNRHLRRLDEDAQRLMISIDIELVRLVVLQAIHHLIHNDLPQYTIKIHVSRGTGGRGYQLPNVPLAHVLISFHLANRYLSEWSSEYQYKVEIAQLQLSTQPMLAGIKHLNRLEQILVKHELQSRQVNDLLLCDQSKHVIEATAANLFVYMNGVWYTPELTKCGVSGVFRQAVLDYLLAQDCPAIIQDLSICELQNAQSMFICNALTHIVPVSHFIHNQETRSYDMQLCMQLCHAMEKWMLQYHQGLSTHNKKDVL